MPVVVRGSNAAGAIVRPPGFFAPQPTVDGQVTIWQRAPGYSAFSPVAPDGVQTPADPTDPNLAHLVDPTSIITPGPVNPVTPITLGPTAPPATAVAAPPTPAFDPSHPCANFLGMQTVADATAALATMGFTPDQAIGIFKTKGDTEGAACLESLFSPSVTQPSSGCWSLFSDSTCWGPVGSTTALVLGGAALALYFMFAGGKRR